jgi:hypothetical protein
MGGLLQLAEMIMVAGALCGVALVVAFLVSRLFPNPKTRKYILISVGVICVLAVCGYFGFIAFILRGNLNSN